MGKVPFLTGALFLSVEMRFSTFCGTVDAEFAQGVLMFKTKRYAVMVLTDLLLVVALIFLVAFVIPDSIRDQKHISLFVWLTVVGIFLVLSTLLHLKSFKLVEKIRNRTFHQQETGLLMEFVDKLRFCYSMDDFYENIGSILEEKGDCSVLFIDRQKDYVLYNSSDKLT